MARRRCVVCGAVNATCGSHTDDRPSAVVKERSRPVRSEPVQLKNYDVSGKVVDGRVMPAGACLRLSDEDAERYGLKKATGSANTGEERGGPKGDLVTSKRAGARTGRRPAKK